MVLRTHDGSIQIWYLNLLVFVFVFFYVRFLLLLFINEGAIIGKCFYKPHTKITHTSYKNGAFMQTSTDIYSDRSTLLKVTHLNQSKTTPRVSGHELSFQFGVGDIQHPCPLRGDDGLVDCWLEKKSPGGWMNYQKFIGMELHK